MVLKDIAKINIGLVVSRLSSIELLEEGQLYNYFTLSSAEHDQTIDQTKLKELKTNSVIDDKFLSRKGDIIIGLSSPHSLAYINNESSGIIIPSQFALIRVSVPNVLPEYLIAYLASDEIQHKIIEMEKGATVKTVDLSKLSNLPICLLSLMKQKQIAHLNALIKEENKINYLYAKLKEKANNYYINKLIEDRGATK